MKDSHLRRREFLTLAAGVAMGAVCRDGIPAASAESRVSQQWKMTLSCSSINFASLPIEKAVERISALGFDAIDIWSAHAGCPHLDDVLERLGSDGLKELLAKHELDLYSFSVYRGGYARYAKLLGEAGGGVAVRGSGSPKDASDVTSSMKHFLESLKPEIELAEKHNSYLAIENHSGKALLNYMDSIKAFVDQNRHPRLGIALAPYHIQKNGESVEEAIGICGKQLLFFYAWQNATGVEQLPGVGPTDCTPWLRALAKTGFRYPVNPFMHHEPAPDAMSNALVRSRKYLIAQYEKMDGTGGYLLKNR